MHVLMSYILVKLSNKLYEFNSSLFPICVNCLATKFSAQIMMSRCFLTCLAISRHGYIITNIYFSYIICGGSK